MESAQRTRRACSMSVMPSGLLVSSYWQGLPRSHHGLPRCGWSTSYTGDIQGSSASSVLAFLSVQRLPGQMTLRVIVSLSLIVGMNFRPFSSSSFSLAKSMEARSISPVSIAAMREVISGICLTMNLPMCAVSIQCSATAWTTPRSFGFHSPMVNGPEPTGTNCTAAAPIVS